MRIGLIDVDTSHPGNWIPIERELGHEVVGLWDGGSVHPQSYVQEFAQQHNVPKVYPSLEAMAGDVDCAVIHGCDWDTHIDKARPFVDAGKCVLIDKPLAGNLRDLHQLKAWSDEGIRLTGGSSLRFCEETEEFFSQPVEKRGTAHTAICGCGVDEFNYGIHAYSMLAGIMGVGASTIRHLGQGTQHRIEIDYPDGRVGIVVIGQTEKWLPFYSTIVTEKKVVQFTADTANLYRGLLTKALSYLAGETDDPPVSIEDLLEPEMWALAARKSWSEGDRPIKLTELSEDDAGYDGAGFAEQYRRAKYPP